MRNWRLYVVLDKELAGARDLAALALDVIAGGADVVQLRDKISSTRGFLKDAGKIRAITRESHTTLIINDRPDIAKAVDADGVHLGQHDLPLKGARAVLGDFKLIGISCRSLEQALEAESQGADYIGLGPMFKTFTKPDLTPIGYDLVSKLKDCLKIPFVCIGGINITNIEKLFSAGAETVAVAGAIINSKQPRLATQEMVEFLNLTKEQNDTVGVRQE